ncbi:homoaconitase [bacterium]|nr:homoaconitase [bacterium]
MAQNIIEKIVQKYTVGLPAKTRIRSGDFVLIKPEHVMTHDNTGAVMKKFVAIGAEKIINPRQIVFALDHNVQDTSEANLEKYAAIQAFAETHGLDFYPAGCGIGHQIMCEEGYAWPGTMVVASDSHSNMYGGLGCLGTPVVRTDAAALWATGQTWWQVPPVARIELTGSLRPGTTGKDVIITLCGFFHQDEVLNHALEFWGEGVAHLSIEQRLTIANMTTEWGALAGVFPVDQATLHWLKQRVAAVKKRGPLGVASDKEGRGHHPRLNKTRLDQLNKTILNADPDAQYARTLTLDLGSVNPAVSGPNQVKTWHSARTLEQQDIKIHKAYLLSCVNARLEDFAEAARIVRGKKVASHVSFYIAAASRDIQRESEERGDWQALLEAGAIQLPAGCGPCIGLGAGLLADGEVGISATNRNFKGRMGSRNAEAYLASPAIVAASALAGKIVDPFGLCGAEIKGTHTDHHLKPGSEQIVPILPGFPARIEGTLVYCHQDNLNTDGIFPGKYTYKDDFTPEQQAQVVMENYDPEFRSLISRGDILVGGYNFGTGSSREQAATALKYSGIALVLAGSFSETYKRNAINNGFLVIEVPALIDALKAEYGTNKLTVRTDNKVIIDFARSRIKALSHEYDISPIGTAVQELIICGGLENWVQQQLNKAEKP